MKIRTIYNPLRLLLLAALLAMGCEKREDPNLLRDEALKQPVLALLNADPQFSSFVNLLSETGMDSVLASSKVFTVFAPTNDALQALNPVATASLEAKRRFVSNHIAPSLFSIQSAGPAVRLEMLNGKFNQVSGMRIEGASVKSANSFAANGVVHQIDAPVYALDNCWEFMNGPSAPAKQRAFLGILNRKVFDLSNAVLVGVDPNTGANIYQPGSDSVFANLYLRNVQDLDNEKKLFTVFVPEDAAWEAEMNTYRPYFTASTPDSTEFATGWNVYRDFAVDTLLEPASLPSSVLTKSGVRIVIDKNNISQSIKTSNGYVYVMKSLGMQPADKFTTRIIEGENYVLSSVNRRSNTFFRDRFNPLTNQPYRDVLVLNHGVALFNLRYDIHEVPNIKYKAYWVAVNDFQTAAFNQRIGVGAPTSTLLPYVSVPANNRTEVYLGEFTVGQYMPTLNIFLTAANSTSNAANPLVCDYIKLVPSL